MSSRLPRWIILQLMLVAGCGEDGSVLPNASKAESREPTPVEFETLEFTHDTLGIRLHRVDSLARGIGLPEEHAIGWSRQQPNANHGRKLHSFVAQWSTHRMRLGDALQPDQRPGSKIRITADVNPVDPRKVCRFSLSAIRRSELEGWDAFITLFTSRPYKKNSVGEERLKIHMLHTDRTTQVSLPVSGWSAEVATDGTAPRDADTVVTIQANSQAPNLKQTVALLASPVSFLNEVRRELDATERRVLDDIAASRNVRLGRYHYTTSIPDPSQMEFRDMEVPADFELSAREKQAFTANLTDWIQSRRKLFEENHEEIHAAITKAFPIDEYFAAEANVSEVGWAVPTRNVKKLRQNADRYGPSVVGAPYLATATLDPQ